MPLTIIRNDITKMDVDAIVNAANASLLAGGGVCGAIFAAAGEDKLQKACNKLAPVNTGDAVITKGFSLPAKYIIHAVGPVYQGGGNNEESLLRACYENSLNLAKKHGCDSIAFPLISSGIYGYPKDEALTVATDTISKWLMKDDMDVSLVVFDKAAFELSGDLLGEVKAFIDENYVDERHERFGRMRTRHLFEDDVLSTESAIAPSPMLDGTESIPDETVMAPRPKSDNEKSMPDASVISPRRKPDITASIPTDFLSHEAMPSYMRQADSALHSTVFGDFGKKLDEPFSTTLLRLIDAKGKTDVEIYKRANLDRKLFSKIRTGKKYMPSKKTAVALAVAMELSLPETRELLERAGFVLSRSVMFDVIIEYFISRRKYDIYEINNVLFEYDQQLLGG